MAVTVEIFISTGAKAVRARRSENPTKALPRRNEHDIIIDGLSVFMMRRIKHGTAIPTKEIGPAKATTSAERRLEIRITAMRRTFTFTPMENA